MAEEQRASFEHEALEVDIKRLAEEIRRTRERPELKGASSQEIIKQSIRSFTPTVPQSQLQPGGASKSPLPAYAADAPAETKLEIEYLLDLAFHKGISAANAEATKSNPFVLDAFHDALAGKLYPELQKRGIVK